MDEAIARYPQDQQRSAAMPLLHLWQEHFGFIGDNAVTWIANQLGLQPINILELVSFYPMYRTSPVGKTHIRVCRTLSCAMAGSYELMARLREAISGKPDYSIEFVECLASCGTAPVCMVGDELYENVDPNSAADRLLNQTSNIKHQTLPHPLEHRLIFKNIGRKNWKTDIETYLKDGGYE